MKARFKMQCHRGRFFRMPAFVLCMLILIPLQVMSDDVHTYTLAVVPQVPVVEVQKKWAPFLRRLSGATGMNFQLKTYTSISRFESDVLSGGPDFVFMNPYHMVMARKTQGYIPLVRDDDELKGILVVRKDSGIRSVKELNGKEISFPSPNAFAAALYMRALLTEREKIRFTPRYVKTHSNVYRTVLLGKAAAGGGINKTFQLEPQGLRDVLMVIYETPGAAPHPIAVHPRVPQEARKKAATAILKMGRANADQALLQAIQFSRPREADYEKDYLPLEGLGLGTFVMEGEE